MHRVFKVSCATPYLFCVKDAGCKKEEKNYQPFISREVPISRTYNCILLEHRYTAVEDKNRLDPVVKKFAYSSEQTKQMSIRFGGTVLTLISLQHLVYPY